MLLPSEIEARSLIPAIRSLLARKLTTEYDLKEEIVAKVLGVTQAAVSNYIRGTRGDTQLMLRLSSTPNIMVMIEDIAVHRKSSMDSLWGFYHQVTRLFDSGMISLGRY